MADTDSRDGATIITPNMIAAGVAALPFFEPAVLGTMTEENLVREVYRAMEAARIRDEE